MTSVLSQARSHLRAGFNLHSHHPNSTQTEALDDLLLHLNGMAEGKLDSVFWLSSLDPGVGKTSAVIAYLRALVESSRGASVGALLGFFKRTEIRDVVHNCELPKEAFAVLTNDEELNALGSDNPTQAQVLFTTQQRIALLTRGRCFAEAASLHYLGLPRQVRLWDESFRPGHPICLSRDKLLAVIGQLRGNFPEQAERLEKLLVDLGQREDGDVVALEGMESQFGLDLRTVLSQRRGLDADDRELLEDLMLAGGSWVKIRKPSSIEPHYLVTAADGFPPDLAPLLILDASARIRYTYRIWEQSRANLRPLRLAAKDYSGLTVHYWPVGAGHRAVQEGADRFAQAISSVIREEAVTSPSSKWLVVHRKRKGRDVDLAQEIRDELPSELHSLVSFVTWGKHTATNEFSGCTHVILVGGIYLPRPVIEAGCMAAAGHDARLKVSKDTQARFALGEQLHHLLQAACRIGIRRGTNVSQEFHLYLIAARRHGLAERLADVFPGCRVIDWSPIRNSLIGHAERVYEYVIERLPRASTEIVAYTEIERSLEFSHRNDLQQVRSSKTLLWALEEEGIQLHYPNPAASRPRSTGYRRVPVVT